MSGDETLIGAYLARGLSCAILGPSGSASGSAKCWGTDEVADAPISVGALGGQMGDALEWTAVGNETELAGFFASSSQRLSCALRGSDRRAVCSGARFQSGPDGRREVAAEEDGLVVDHLGAVSAMALTRRTGCALVLATNATSGAADAASTSRVRCWGELGDGNVVHRDVFSGARDLEVTGVRELHLHDLGGCAAFADGRVKCWQQQQQDVLPQQQAQAQQEQVARGVLDLASAAYVDGVSDVVSLAAGLDFACVAQASGAVKCWGDNAYIVPGRSSTAPADVDIAATRKLVASDLVVCALLASGEVKCWGQGVKGQLGTGRPRDGVNSAFLAPAELPPVDLGSGLRATDIVASASHVCAMLEQADGKGEPGLKCWGANDEGQLGLGDTQLRGLGRELANGTEVSDMGDALPFVYLVGPPTASPTASPTMAPESSWPPGRIVAVVAFSLLFIVVAYSSRSLLLDSFEFCRSRRRARRARKDEEPLADQLATA